MLINYMRRYGLAASSALIVLCCLIGSSRGQRSYDGNLAERMLDMHTVELRTQLKSGLRVINSEQLHFIDLVIARVEAKQLPRAMVNIVYLWAIEKNPSVPFPYFQIAMRALAARRNVTL